MTASAATGPTTLCLGEALVDLIGEQHAPSLGAVQQFTPHFGGATANVAVAASRAGARVSLAGGVGADEWGKWLLERLRAEGVGSARFELLDGIRTRLAFASIDGDGEPTYRLFGEPAQAIAEALEEDVEDAVDEADGLFISTNTLAASRERAVTMRARARALELGRPVVFDCNLRLHRWSSRADAAASANACVPGALMVRTNQPEAELMTGEADPERAALAMRKAGARMVVVTLGARGAILRGSVRADVAAVPAHVRSTIGAGDAFTGTLLARLALSAYYPDAAAVALPEAAAAAARACERWGAHE